MKRSLSLVLAVLMVATLLVPILTLAVAATGNTAGNTAPSYLIYQQDFSTVESDATGTALMEQLGWYIPTSKVATDKAAYSIVQRVVGTDNNGKDIINQSLRVNTLEATAESFVNIFAGDVMSILRNTDFVLKYRLTYREETTNANGYAAVIYNYNEMHGSVANGEGNEAYGIAAVRMCGTGLNAVYYPVAGADCTFNSLEKDPGSPNTMANRYDAVSGQPSLYARLFNVHENSDEIRKDTFVMANRVLNVEISYDHEDGVFVFINGVRVSDMNYDLQYNASFRNENLWQDFVERNTGAAIALLTQPGIVADIDDITVETSNIQAVGDEAPMPSLLITEISGYPSAGWGKFIEICNPTDKPVDVANYSLVFSSTVTSGSATDAIIGSRTSKYTSYVKLGDFFGKELLNDCPQFFTTTALASEPSWSYAVRWYFSDAEIAAMQAMGFDAVKASTTKYQRDTKPSGSNNYNYKTYSSGTAYYLCDISPEVPFSQMEDGNFTPDASGIYRLAHYAENWNTRYTRGSSDYETNTMLNPGDCMILRLASTSSLTEWKQGMTNNGNLTTEFVHRQVGTKNYGFRYTYQNYGLSKETKVLAITGISVYDAGGCTVAIGASTDMAGNEVKYTDRYLSDLSYIESIVTYIPAMAIGKQLETDSMHDSANIGHGGEVQQDYSASFVYGVDASSDYRRGVLYTALTPVNNRTNSHVGRLADYQKIIMIDFYKRAESTPELMITEIMPRTNNLEGEALSAFGAMELTNTSGEAVNVYDYSLVRTSRGPGGAPLNSGFKYSTAMKPGNPVVKGEGNGAYYYFAEDSISNPDTCVLQPGESVVVWFLTEDTYSSYYTEDEFGVEYFRQYWINNGCPDLGIKFTDGEYAVKVIAVDGCDSETYNAPNYGRVFSLANGTYNSKGVYQNNTAALYGVAKIAGEFEGVVASDDVISIAYFGLAPIYYELNKTELPAVDGTDTLYYANVLKCFHIPVNTGMRYVVGLNQHNRISAMKLTIKVQRYSYSGSIWTSTSPTATMKYTLDSKSANQAPGLGTLEGEEAYCVRDALFLGDKAEGSDSTVYRYFSDSRNAIATLAGAAVSTVKGEPAKLRFDSVVRLDTFTSLAATYGNNFKFGTLIVKSSALSENTQMTKDDLIALGAKDVKSDLLYYTDDFAVLGASIEVAAADYGTDYTAVAYMEVKTQDGKTHVYYSADTAERSVDTVARAAMKDLKSEANDVYKYKTSNGKYSRFDADERKALQSYFV